jgi:hypothetical protein
LLTDFSFGADISCSLYTNRIDGIIVSVLDSSGADFGIKPGGIKLKTITLVFAAFPLSMQH